MICFKDNRFLLPGLAGLACPGSLGFLLRTPRMVARLGAGIAVAAALPLAALDPPADRKLSHPESAQPQSSKTATSFSEDQADPAARHDRPAASQSSPATRDRGSSYPAAANLPQASPAAAEAQHSRGIEHRIDQRIRRMKRRDRQIDRLLNGKARGRR